MNQQAAFALEVGRLQRRAIEQHSSLAFDPQFTQAAITHCTDPALLRQIIAGQEALAKVVHRYNDDLRQVFADFDGTGANGEAVTLTPEQWQLIAERV